VIANLDCEFGQRVVAIGEHSNHPLEPPWIWTWIHNNNNVEATIFFWMCVEAITSSHSRLLAN